MPNKLGASEKMLVRHRLDHDGCRVMKQKQEADKPKVLLCLILHVAFVLNGTMHRQTTVGVSGVCRYPIINLSLDQHHET